MSDPVSALGQPSFDGIAHVREAGLHGMIAVRGDLADGTLRAAATSFAEAGFPEPGTARLRGADGLLWMSPDELLVLCPYAARAETVQRLSVALEGSHALVADVSDARALFELSGPQARDALSKLVPVDLAPSVFTPGMFRRTRMAQIPAAFWLHEADTFRIVTFRSVARYAFDLLKTAAMPGSEVGLHR